MAAKSRKARPRGIQAHRHQEGVSPRGALKRAQDAGLIAPAVAKIIEEAHKGADDPNTPSLVRARKTLQEMDQALAGASRRLRKLTDPLRPAWRSCAGREEPMTDFSPEAVDAAIGERPIPCRFSCRANTSTSFNRHWRRRKPK